MNEDSLVALWAQIPGTGTVHPVTGSANNGLHKRTENRFKGSECYDLFIASGQKQGLIIYYFHLYDLRHQWGIFTDLS